MDNMSKGNESIYFGFRDSAFLQSYSVPEGNTCKNQIILFPGKQNRFVTSC